MTCTHDNLFRVGDRWKCFRLECEFSISAPDETTDEFRVRRGERICVRTPSGDLVGGHFEPIERTNQGDSGCVMPGDATRPCGTCGGRGYLVQGCSPVKTSAEPGT